MFGIESLSRLPEALMFRSESLASTMNTCRLSGEMERVYLWVALFIAV